MFEDKTKKLELLAAPFTAGMRIATGEDPGQVMKETAGKSALAITGADALVESARAHLGGLAAKSIMDSLK